MHVRRRSTVGHNLFITEYSTEEFDARMKRKSMICKPHFRYEFMFEVSLGKLRTRRISAHKLYNFLTF